MTRKETKLVKWNTVYEEMKLFWIFTFQICEVIYAPFKTSAFEFIKEFSSEKGSYIPSVNGISLNICS